MDRESSPDYKALFLKSQEEIRKSTQNTAFIELIRTCHELLSQPLQADSEHPYRLFWSVTELQGVAKSLGILHSEDELATYEKLGVENHVRNIISELCNRPEAQQRFKLGKGVSFESHTNSFEAGARDDPSQRPRPDRFCIHHKLDGSSDVLMTVEYKPPHKLTVENLRVGLRPMNFRDEVAQRESIPTEKASKLQYNAEQMVGAVLVQEYHVMICEGLEYSYVTIGLALVLLRVPLEAPDTLLYFLCEPNMEVQDDLNYRQPTTAIARILCLALMSCQSQVRDNAWRKQTKSKLSTWATSFALIRSRIPEVELQETPSGSEYTGSDYAPSSSPLQSPTPRARVRVESGCAPSQSIKHHPDSGSDSDSSEASPEPRRKRNISQITSSPPQQSSRSEGSRRNPGDQSRQHKMQFCTQSCLLGLQQNDILDEKCPNVALHTRGQSDKHQITALDFLRQLNQQLDTDIDQHCTPLNKRGSYGASFKITCAIYGYTVVGKGTTTHLWPHVSREIEVYRVLQRAQGSAIPVFLGPIDLNMSYFLHGAGEIRHMLLMGWGGETINSIEHSPELQKQIRRSRKEINSLGVTHGDLRLDNLLWSEELQRVLIIDFHRSQLNYELKRRQVRKQFRWTVESPMYSSTVHKLYNPYIQPITKTIFVGRTGKLFWLAEPLRFTEPLGKKVLILDVDSRHLDGPKGVLSKAPLNATQIPPDTSGRLNHFMFAMIHGYDYRLVQIPRTVGRSGTWTKVTAIKEALEHYEYVVFMDADSMMPYPNLPMEWLFNYWEIMPETLVAMALDPDAPHNRDWNGRTFLNTGFIIAQQSPRTNELFEAWESCPNETRYPDCGRWGAEWPHEQSAFGNHVRGKWVP
ncbi:hypothetical protein PITC_024060 [Penicillium italicum]|uniref:Uncharacterized protein n=1 Tax=Penicillium italicum TaxID=40296 RepID=A0A0A2LB82_PENIT|nr:hypothetical protein PITC_024060 [Penicillium italicum]